jgi:hypothetical protein
MGPSGQLLRQRNSAHGRNVFQRLADAISIMEGEQGASLFGVLSATQWDELRPAFATRHVRAHNLGIADALYVSSGGSVRLGQRVQVTRTAAERALQLIERLVQAM